MSRADTQAELFSRYVEICNKALEENCHRFPFKQILAAAARAQSRKHVEVLIVDDHPEGSFVIHFDQDRIASQKHTSCNSCDCARQWRVSQSYLEDVVQNPDAYIANPAKIDWEWMYKAEEG